MHSVIRWDKDEHEIVSLILDDPGQKVNTVSVTYIRDLRRAVDQLDAEISEGKVAGVILRSGKSSFLAGGDLNRLMDAKADSLDEFVADIDMRKSLTLRLESMPVPVVAVVNGPVLGGGLELVLCCDHSIAVDDGRVQAGLPESRLGLMPGAGGVMRTVRRLGIDVALDELILPGRKFSLDEARSLGLLGESAASMCEAISAATAWILDHPDTKVDSAVVTPQSGQRRLPPPRAVPVERAVVRAANAAIGEEIPGALHAESVEFGSVVVSPATKNALRVHFFATNALRKRVRTLASTGTVPQDLHPGDTPLAGEPMDHVGDGQQCVEFIWDGSEASSGIAAGLLRSGVIPVLLTPGRDRLSLVMADALTAAIDAAEADPRREGDIDRALYWAGINTGGRGTTVLDEVTWADVDLACGILDEMADAGRDAVRNGTLAFEDDQDAASVRVGGFPGWTGGIANWHAAGRQLADALYSAESGEER